MEVDHDAHSDLHEEDDEEEGEEGSQHPGGLLPGAAAAQEAHDGDQSTHLSNIVIVIVAFSDYCDYG